jgi:hypothetical protein
VDDCTTHCIIILNKKKNIQSTKMKGAVLVAIVASIGNFLQGWDNATIAGKYYTTTTLFLL